MDNDTATNETVHGGASNNSGPVPDLKEGGDSDDAVVGVVPSITTLSSGTTTNTGTTNLVNTTTTTTTPTTILELESQNEQHPVVINTASNLNPSQLQQQVIPNNSSSNTNATTTDSTSVTASMTGGSSSIVPASSSSLLSNPTTTSTSTTTGVVVPTASNRSGSDGGSVVPANTSTNASKTTSTVTSNSNKPILPSASTANNRNTSTAAPLPPVVKKQKKRMKDAAPTKDESGVVKKKVRKINRNNTGGAGGRGGNGNTNASGGPNASSSNHPSGSGPGSGGHNHINGMPSIHNGLIVHDGLSAAQKAAQEQMRRALEEDQYSLVGSIMDTESDDDDIVDGDHPYTTNYTYNYRGSAVRLDKAAMIQAVRKYILLEQRIQQQASTNSDILDDDYDDDDNLYGMKDDDNDAGQYYSNETTGASTRRSAGNNGNNNNSSNKALNNKKKKRKDELTQLQEDAKLKQSQHHQLANASKDPLSLMDIDDDLDRDGGSIFGATTGQSNSTWVECDKCKKWRRLRGVVDEKKLPSKWYCSMNKNDPDRARCSAPEEEYETSHTPESAADSRTRKHLRVWVRRLQCNEAYESRQPTLTRGKKRNAVSSSSNHPYEWVRCCNPSCGKWRALLRIMDAKGNVVDRTTDGEWYCVMNNWDEKMASCAAPQENLPAVGCPPWVMQDNH